jgi:predicted MFS family arabinose efflux permease
MEGRSTRYASEPKQSYFALIFSVFPMMRQYPEILLSGAIQGLGFGSFLAIWMGIGLHLTSPEMGYGTDTVGYLAVLTIFNLAVTPRLGRWADRIGPRRARLIMTTVQVFGVLMYSFVGHSLWLMIIPILITNTGGPVIDVSNRMTFLKEAPNVRTRLMTIYIVMMFIGGGIASWAGTAAYDFAGWHGTSLLAFCLSALLFILSLIGYRWKGAR